MVFNMTNLGIFKFTGRRRYVLTITFTALNFIQIILGLLMTGGSLYIVIGVSGKFYSEKAEITFVFTVTGMFGTHVVITYLVGIKIGDKCYNLAHKKSTGKHLTVWTIGSINTSLNIVIIGILATKISNHIIRSLRHSLEKGMQNYLKDPNWKHILDRWQFKMQCCGVHSHEDWYKISWLDKYHVNTDNAIVKELRTSQEHVHLPVLPWSCCRTDFPMQCFHDPLQQLNSRYLWEQQPNLILDSINPQGCLNVLRYPVETVLSSIILICIVLIFIQILILIISRLLFTSCKSAIILGDPDGVAPGWIFSRNLFANRPYRTLSEILIDLGVPQNEIARYQAFKEELPEVDEQDISAKTSPHSVMETPKDIITRISNSAHKIKPKISKASISKTSVTKTSVTKTSITEATSDADPISSADEEALMLK